MKENRKNPAGRRLRYLPAALFFWLLIWELFSRRLSNPVLLPAPSAVLRTLVKMLTLPETRSACLGSAFNIGGGFFLALFLGLALGILLSRSELLDALVSVPLKLAKTVPVACFVILLLVWLGSRRIGMAVSFLIVLPVIYENVRAGVSRIPEEENELSRMFRLSFRKRLRYIMLSNLYGYLTAGLKIALGLCWKAGVAAEVIGLSAGTIGRSLYDSKLYLDMPALFSWTILLVGCSIVFEYSVLLLFRIPEALLLKPAVKRSAADFLFFVLLGKEREDRVPPDAHAAEPVPAAPPKKMRPSVRPGLKETEHTAGMPEEPAGLGHVTVIRSGKTVLSDYSLLLPPGSLTILTGPSGCGKTTVLRLLSGLTEPDSGTLLRKPEGVISVCFQEDRLFPEYSALENVMLADSSRPEEAAALLREFGIVDFSGKAAKRFSGGEKRRIALVRALYTPSPLLLLDEPFSGIQEELAESMITRIALGSENRTIVVVTHIPSEIAKFDEIFKGLGRTVRIENVAASAICSEKST